MLHLEPFQWYMSVVQEDPVHSSLTADPHVVRLMSGGLVRYRGGGGTLCQLVP